MKENKKLWVAIAVLYIFALVAIFCGSMIMFGEYAGYYSINYFFSGMITMVGFLLTLTGFIFFLMCKEKLQQGIGLFVFPVFSSILVGISYIIGGGYKYSEMWLGAYAICCVGIAFLLFVMILAVVMIFLSHTRQENKKASTNTDGRDADVYSELKKIKELYDLGVFTQQEF